MWVVPFKSSFFVHLTIFLRYVTVATRAAILKISSGGGYPRIYRVWWTNQSARKVLSTCLVNTNTNITYAKSALRSVFWSPGNFFVLLITSRFLIFKYPQDRSLVLYLYKPIFSSLMLLPEQSNLMLKVALTQAWFTSKSKHKHKKFEKQRKRQKNFRCAMRWIKCTSASLCLVLCYLNSLCLFFFLFHKCEPGLNGQPTPAKYHAFGVKFTHFWLIHAFTPHFWKSTIFTHFLASVPAFIQNVAQYPFLVCIFLPRWMFCSTSLTVSRTNSRTNVTPNCSKLLLGSDIVQFPVRNWGGGGGGVTALRKSSRIFIVKTWQVCQPFWTNIY